MTDKSLPAFPVYNNNHVGMSLRDYFAAAALPAVFTGLYGEYTHTQIASVTYKIADAMIAEGEKSND